MSFLTEIGVYLDSYGGDIGYLLTLQQLMTQVYQRGVMLMGSTGSLGELKKRLSQRLQKSSRFHPIRSNYVKVNESMGEIFRII